MPHAPPGAIFSFKKPIAMFCTIITDCFDENAKGRQSARAQTFFNLTPNIIATATDLEAAGNLIDVIDATAGKPGLIMVNVAPRGGNTRTWENGTPFGYTWYKDTLIVGTVGGLCFSSLKKFELVKEVHVLDTTTATAALLQAGAIDADIAAYIPKTQFRSYEYMPRIAAALLSNVALPHTTSPISDWPQLPDAIWWIDNFGNCKTTLTENDVASNTTIKTHFGSFPFVTQLKDVCDQETAVTIGSSGLLGKRFLEIVAQRNSAAAKHKISVGDGVFSGERFGLKV